MGFPKFLAAFLFLAFFLVWPSTTSGEGLTFPLEGIPQGWLTAAIEEYHILMERNKEGYTLYLVGIGKNIEKQWHLPFWGHLNVKLYPYVEDDLLYIISEQPFSASQHNAAYSFDGSEIKVQKEWSHDPSAVALEEVEKLLQKGDLGQAREVLKGIFYPFRYYNPQEMMARFLLRGHEMALKSFWEGDYEQAAAFLDHAFSLPLGPDLLPLESRSCFDNNPLSDYLPFNRFLVILNDYGFFLEQSGRLDEAEEILRNVLRLQGDRLVAHLNMADTLWGLYRYYESHDYYIYYHDEMVRRGNQASIPPRVLDNIALVDSLKDDFAPEEYPLYFEDPVLSGIIRQALDNPHDPIFPRDAQKLEKLIISNGPVSSLQGLEAFTSLNYLYIYSYNLEDFTPLAHLPNLRTLYLDSYYLDDLSFLNSLTNLETLSLLYNEDKDLSPLQNLTSLTELHLSIPQGADMQKLEALNNLKFLRIPFTEVQDHSFLSSLTSLEELYYNGYPFTHFDVLAPLINLKALSLPYHEVEDISPLANMKELNYLFLGHYPIPDISPLQALTNLESLELSMTDPQGLETIRYLENLKFLALRWSDLEDISHLSSLVKLEQLTLAYNEIGDISPLNSLTKLELLDLSWNSISDISPLGNLDDLKYLYLTHNNISCINPLLKNPRLGPGLMLFMEYNGLDVSPGSSTLRDIEELQNRGAIVFY